MKNTQPVWYIRSTFAVLAIVLCAAWGVNTAHADAAQGAQLSIASNGQIIVRGATVVGVSGHTITVTTNWNGTKLYWNVETTGSTKFTPDLGSSATLKKIVPGHTIGFTGVMNGSGEGASVLASAVRDEVLVQSSVSVVGTVQSIDPETNSFILKVADGERKIIAVGGTLMTRDGNGTTVSGIAIGDSGRVTGTLDASTGTMTADRISIKSPTEPVVATKPRASGGVFASVMKWLQGSRGILSVRER